jgi:hypothetical protein
VPLYPSKLGTASAISMHRNSGVLITHNALWQRFPARVPQTFIEGSVKLFEIYFLRKKDFMKNITL